MANYLTSRYNQQRGIEDLNDAIVLKQQALALCPPARPGRCTSANDLAFVLFTRFTRLCRLEELFNLHDHLADVPQTVSLFDLFATGSWVCMAEHFHYPITLLAYEIPL